MAVAYFKAHAARGFWPIANHGELAVLYCFAFLFVAMHGAGRFGVDRVWRRRGGKAVESNSDLIEHATRWRAFQRQATLSNLTHEH